MREREVVIAFVILMILLAGLLLDGRINADKIAAQNQRITEKLRVE